MPALGNLNSCASPLESTPHFVDSPRDLAAILDDGSSLTPSRTRRLAITYARGPVTRSRFLASPAYARGTYQVSATAAPFQTNKVLQGQRGCENLASSLYCTSSEVAVWTSLAVKGDATIHGPSLVARPVGSEWRTRHPQCEVHPTKYKGDHQ